jgi:hypothetical protein
MTDLIETLRAGISSRNDDQIEAIAELARLRAPAVSDASKRLKKLCRDAEAEVEAFEREERGE